MKITEDDLQEICVRWFRLQHSERIICSFPNGGKRHISVAAKLKRTGALAGMPDLMIPCAKGDYHGMFIEMKLPNNYPTKKQKEIISKLSTEGYYCIVCKAFEDFQKEVNWYLSL